MQCESLRNQIVNKQIEIDRIMDLRVSCAHVEAEGFRCTVAEFTKNLKDKEGQVESLSETIRAQRNTIADLKRKIRVFCTVRPLPTDEKGEGGKLDFTIVNNKPLKTHSVDTETADATSQYAFGHAFGPDAKQRDVCKEIPELDCSALDGYRVCIFPYGQTGSRKTHTMIRRDSDGTMGMIPRSVEQIFEVAAGMKDRGWSFKFMALLAIP